MLRGNGQVQVNLAALASAADYGHPSRRARSHPGCININLLCVSVDVDVVVF